jgi:hypothetical protein
VNEDGERMTDVAKTQIFNIFSSAAATVSIASTFVFVHLISYSRSNKSEGESRGESNE